MHRAIPPPVGSNINNLNNNKSTNKQLKIHIIIIQNIQYIMKSTIWLQHSGP
jgi:hypothetical protein